MTTFICSSCRVGVPKSEKVKHVKSDWHIYNLKRVVADLLPISEEAFNQKKEILSLQLETPNIKSTYCKACKKSFSNSKSYTAHLSSKKHHQSAERIKQTVPSTIPNYFPVEKPVIVQENSCVPKPLPLGSCLFCDRRISTSSDLSEFSSESQEKLLANRVMDHMFDAHKFTVPFPDNLTDPAGLLKELGRIVGEERACLACGRQFYGSRLENSNNDIVSLAAVRNHMIDKPGHKQVWCGPEDPVEVALLVAKSEEISPEGNTTIPPVGLAGGELFSQFYDHSVVVPPFILPDDEDVYEVRLPSGNVVGHRKLQFVYQQHLGNDSVLATTKQFRQSSSKSYSTNFVSKNSHALITSRTNPLAVLSNKKYDFNFDRKLVEHHKKCEVATDLRSNLVYLSRARKQC